ncbi:threonine synthase, partial [bacterium]|nr:threonine synthase [bacterium]
MPETRTNITDIYCSKCDKRYDSDAVLTLCSCGAPLLVDYDYNNAAAQLTPEILGERPNTMWKYIEVLPVKQIENIVSLGEGSTPLLHSRMIGESLGLESLYFKDETVNPTGSFKARGLAMAVSKAKELGLEKLIIPTAGNAGSALAAYCARAGLQCKIVMPKDTPAPFKVDGIYYGAEIEEIEGSIKDCGGRASELMEQEGWFSIATLKEPYRIEGKKTMGYELAEQFDFNLPDVIIYPTGGGTGLIGMWKAFDEMEKMGWIGSKRPKMVAVQAEGCAPIPRAFQQGKDHAEEWQNPETVAAGLKVPSAVGDFLMLDAIRQSKGTALAVSDQEMMADTKLLAAREGIFASPEGGAVVTAVKRLVQSKFIKPTDE